MGKVEEEHILPSTVSSDSSEQRNAENNRCCFRCRRIRSLVGLKCVLVLLLSAAVFLSAIFWLPPFLQYADRGDLDLDSRFKDHEIVASFNLMKPVSLLQDNILQLEEDIFAEINIPSEVVVLSLEPLQGSNTTRVVFAVDPEEKNSKLSETAESLIRGSFKFLVTRQTFLQLTPSLFGNASFFEVLKFPGGITIIPVQSAFLLQKVQILFNFTLNFSIYEIQENFKELTRQLKLGLHLAPYENLYVSLSNTRGSTMDAPTIVQSSVVLAVGNTPSTQRLKQLAQTITSRHSKNLGLNNTVFGKVKQVRLSSIMQQYLHGGDGGAPARSPSPAPLPQPPHQHHHHHHHHHHRHNAHLAPEISPEPAASRGSPVTQNGAPAPSSGGAPAPEDGAPTPGRGSPSPEKSNAAKPPGCPFGYRSKGEERKRSHSAPAVAPSKPNVSTHHPAASPHKQVAPSRPISHSVPVSSPLPSVVFAHVQPPSKSQPDKGHFDTRPAVAPTPSTSSAGSHPTVKLAFSLFLALVLHL